MTENTWWFVRAPRRWTADLKETVPEKQAKERPPLTKVVGGRVSVFDPSLRKIFDADVVEKMLRDHPEDVEVLARFLPPEETQVALFRLTQRTSPLTSFSW